MLGLALLATAQLAHRAISRYQDALPRRALGWGLGSGVAALVAVLALSFLTTLARLPQPGGADVRTTRPVLQGLARPPGAILVREHPGLAETESITDEFQSTSLEQIVPFYRQSLRAAGWTETAGGLPDRILLFQRGDCVVTVSLDESAPARGRGRFSVTVDQVRAAPAPLGSPDPARP